jgi:hypothetical protein
VPRVPKEDEAEMSEKAYVVVQLQCPEALGLDEWKGQRYAVVPAHWVLACLREPDFDGFWDADHRRSRWQDTMDTLMGWGDAMVEVSTFGIVVGEFLVQPYLVTPEQYAMLRYQGAA